MNKATIISILIVAVILVGGIYFLSGMNNYTPSINYNTENNNTNSENVQNQTKGTVFFTITDAAANMKNITAVNMTIDKVDVHSETQGWVTVSEDSKTFDLLELKAKSQAELFAKMDLTADTYNQVKIHVAKILVTESGQVKEAKLPSNELKINTNVKVNSNVNSVVEFDMLADKSIHKTGKGEFIFAPVVKFNSTSNANVQVDSNNVVTTSEGKVDSSLNAGMDLDGNIKLDFQLDTNVNLNIDNGVIKIKSSIN